MSILRIFLGLLFLCLPPLARSEDQPPDSKALAGTTGYHRALNWQQLETPSWSEARQLHSGVWTGREMLVWGGAGDSTWFNSGARYEGSSGRWNTLSMENTPSPRCGQSAVWAGDQWLIWGGYERSSHPLGIMVQTGSAYDPLGDRWITIPRDAAPSARADHTAVWTGTEMIIWGGRNKEQPVEGGARYNPKLKTWTPLNRTNSPPPRLNQTMIWTGEESIVWGGFARNETNSLIQGFKYRPDRDEWAGISTQSAPLMRENHTAIWTGKEMIIWGGNAGEVNLNTGAYYNPKTDTWRMISTHHAPSARKLHTAIWTGEVMVIWGGEGNGGNPTDWGTYNPATDTWRKTKRAAEPKPRTNHTMVWTGQELILTGGLAENGDLLQDLWKGKLPPQ